MNKIALSLILAVFVNHISAQITFTNNSSLVPNNSIQSHHAIGVVDLNGDGKDDIIRIDNGEMIYVSYQNEPNQAFTTEFILEMDNSGQSSANTWGVCAGDLDNDGLNDIVCGGFYNGIYIIKSTDSGLDDVSVISDDETFVQGINTFDIDNDGLLDIFSCDDNDLSEVFMNDGSGNYVLDYSIINPESDENSDNSGNYGSVFTDIDNNGHCDLYIAKCRQGVQNDEDPRRINLAFMNDGEGNWTSEGVERNLDSGAQTWIADFGDIDNDGDMDVMFGNHDIQSQLYLNDGNGIFTDITEEADLDGAFQLLCVQGVFEDFDNDGYVDYLMTGGATSFLAFNNGDGTFDVFDDLLNEQTNSFALGDLNRDGFIDIMTASGGYSSGSNSDPDQFLFNDGNENNFVNFELVGTESNINGIGARVTIEGPWGTQIRDVLSGRSYGIQCSLNQNFGLGTSEEIDQVTITWPSGITDTYTNVPGNTFITVTEGEGLVIGIEDEVIDAEHLTLFPNPTVDYITIKTNLKDKVEKIEIFDASGKLVQVNSLLNNNQVDVRDFANGTYSYSISRKNDLIFTGTFIKE